MIRLLVVAVAALGLAAPSPAAADSHYVFTEGSCEFSAVSEPNGVLPPDTYIGAAWAFVAAYAVDLPHNPVTVTRVACAIEVNGVPVIELAGTPVGPLGVLRPTQIQFEAAPDDRVDMCTELTMVVDGGTRAHRDCGESSGPPGFPQPVDYFLHHYLDYVFEEVYPPVVDTATCGAIAEVAPLFPADPVRVDEGNDVYVAGQLFWDCPPFQNQP